MPFLLGAALLLSAGPALAQAPGSPFQGCAFPGPFIVEEPSAPAGEVEHNTYNLPCFVYSGAVVLLEDPSRPANDPHNWSDVLVFWYPGYNPDPGIPANIATYVSDTEDAAGNSNGITDADLAAAGLPFTLAVLLPLPNVYLAESPLGPDNPYLASGPYGQVQYILRSDPPEGPVPTSPKTWGHLKATYR
jgi:hypothetical protein